MPFEIPQKSGAAAMLERYKQVDNFSKEDKEEKSAPQIVGEKKEEDSSLKTIEPCAVKDQVNSADIESSTDAEEEFKVRISVQMPESLDTALCNKLLQIKKWEKRRLTKSDVIRESIKCFIEGERLICPNGHRFVVPEPDGRKSYICPMCGTDTSV